MPRACIRALSILWKPSIRQCKQGKYYCLDGKWIISLLSTFNTRPDVWCIVDEYPRKPRSKLRQLADIGKPGSDCTGTLHPFIRVTSAGETTRSRVRRT